jgi:hypothetical protein
LHLAKSGATASNVVRVGGVNDCASRNDDEIAIPATLGDRSVTTFRERLRIVTIAKHRVRAKVVRLTRRDNPGHWQVDHFNVDGLPRRFQDGTFASTGSGFESIGAWRSHHALPSQPPSRTGLSLP